MVSKNKISLITVCYNSEKTVLDTINSVCGQTYKNKEHIVIDGKSKDSTLSLLEVHRNKFDVLISEPDKGVYDAMNKGIGRASGDIIGFLNSDDLFFDETVLEKIAEAFVLSDADAVYGNLIYVKQNDLNRVVRFWRSNDFVPGLFSKGWCPPHPTFYVRKSVYERLGGFDLTLPIANDVELMMRFMEKENIKTTHIDETLVRMRLGGISNRSIKNILHQNYIILQSLKKHQLPSSAFNFVISKLQSRAVQLCRIPF